MIDNDKRARTRGDHVTREGKGNRQQGGEGNGKVAFFVVAVDEVRGDSNEIQK
jgi:hypothetical protein